MRYAAGRGDTTIGALCSSYVNSGNLGIPIAVYVLGDASLVAPVLLFQVVMVTPIALTVLDLSGRGEKGPWWRRLLAPLRNPIALGSLSGVLVSATGVRVPGPVMDPVTLIGNMSVPAVLLAFGISLRGSALPGRGRERHPVFLAVALKAFGQPVVAWALATTVFGLRGAPLLDVTVTSALPPRRTCTPTPPLIGWARCSPGTRFCCPRCFRCRCWWWSRLYWVDGGAGRELRRKTA